MSNRKAPLNFDILTTADGSPTLSLNGGEKMHSMDGALAESFYIYAPCIYKAATTPNPSILSMGLGLGYNELIALAYFHKNDIDKFKILSFEKEDFLTSSFKLFLQEKSSPLQQVYSQILKEISAHFDISPKLLRQNAHQSEAGGKFILHQSLTLKNPTPYLFNGILYDAFSSETDKELWNQEYLEQFIQNYCQKENCFFSTYAATGNLKRALKTQGFKLTKKEGFGKKRESTFATRLST